MMKKIVSMAMAAVMAATLMVAAAPVEVKAGETVNPESTVSYKNSIDYVNPDYTVTIPPTITFANGAKTANTNVTLKATNGSTDLTEALGTTLEVYIHVKSTNTYTLLNADDTAKAEALDYRIDYTNEDIKDDSGNTTTATLNAGAVTGGAETNGVAIGTLTAEAPKLTGKATLTSLIVPTFDGDYTDHLTFLISDNLEVAAGTP